MKEGTAQVSDIPITDETQKLIDVRYEAQDPYPTVSIHTEAIQGYFTVEASYDLVIDYQNTHASHLIKKHTFRFPGYVFRFINQTQIITKFILKDWCAEQWGLETAQWHNQVIDVQVFQARNESGQQDGRTAVAEVDLAAVVAKAISANGELADYELSWRRREEDGYSEPTEAKYGIEHYTFTTEDASDEPIAVTLEYPLRGYASQSQWYLYVYRFPGYDAEVEYIVNLEANTDLGLSYQFFSGSHVFERNALKDNTYSIKIPRASITQKSALIMAFGNTDTDLSENFDTGYTINGREPTQTVVFDITHSARKLTIDAKPDTGYGVARIVVLDHLNFSEDTDFGVHHGNIDRNSRTADGKWNLP